MGGKEWGELKRGFSAPGGWRTPSPRPLEGEGKGLTKVALKSPKLYTPHTSSLALSPPPPENLFQKSPSPIGPRAPPCQLSCLTHAINGPLRTTPLLISSLLFTLPFAPVTPIC